MIFYEFFPPNDPFQTTCYYSASFQPFDALLFSEKLLWFMMDEVTHELTSKKIKENGEPIVTNTSLSPDGSSTTSGTPTPPNGIPTENWASRYENIGGI